MSNPDPIQVAADLIRDAAIEIGAASADMIYHASNKKWWIAMLAAHCTLERVKHIARENLTPEVYALALTKAEQWAKSLRATSDTYHADRLRGAALAQDALTATGALDE